MPIHKVAGGWRWGDHGKVYANREDAVKQAQAAYAAGYREKEDDFTAAVKRAEQRVRGKK